MKRIWAHVAKSFEEAARFDVEYYRAMSRSERLSTVQWLREAHRTLTQGSPRAGRARLRRFLRVTQHP